MTHMITSGPGCITGVRDFQAPVWFFSNPPSVTLVTSDPFELLSASPVPYGMETCSVRVLARFRPAGSAGVAERDETVASDIKFLDSSTVTFGKTAFTFDNVL